MSVSRREEPPADLKKKPESVRAAVLYLGEPSESWLSDRSGRRQSKCCKRAALFEWFPPAAAACAEKIRAGGLRATKRDAKNNNNIERRDPRKTIRRFLPETDPFCFGVTFEGLRRANSLA